MKTIKLTLLGFFAGIIIGTCIPAFAISPRVGYRSELEQIKLKLADNSASPRDVARGLELLIELSGY